MIFKSFSLQSNENSLSWWSFLKNCCANFKSWFYLISVFKHLNNKIADEVRFAEHCYIFFWKYVDYLLEDRNDVWFDFRSWCLFVYFQNEMDHVLRKKLTLRSFINRCTICYVFKIYCWILFVFWDDSREDRINDEQNIYNDVFTLWTIAFLSKKLINDLKNAVLVNECSHYIWRILGKPSNRFDSTSQRQLRNVLRKSWKMRLNYCNKFT